MEVKKETVIKRGELLREKAVEKIHRKAIKL